MMAESFTAMKVWEVARDLKMPAREMLEFLEQHGFETARKQNQPVDEDTYLAILHRFNQPKFEQYLLEQGKSVEELRQKAEELHERRKKVETKARKRRRAPSRALPPAAALESAKALPPAAAPSLRRPLIGPRRVAPPPPPPPKMPVIRPSSVPQPKPRPVPKVRIAPPPPPPAVPVVRPVITFDFLMTITRERPVSIPTSPLALELIQVALALPHERKLALLGEMRQSQIRAVEAARR